MSENAKNRIKQFKDKLDWRRILDYQKLVKNIPFIIFLSVIAILYIYNGHLADKLNVRINKLEKNIKSLEYEHKSIKSEVIFYSKVSEMNRAVEPLGLKELKELPVTIYDTISMKKSN
jgi:hypothetical protein